MLLRFAAVVAKPALVAVGVGAMLSLAGVDVLGPFLEYASTIVGGILDQIAAWAADHLTPW